MHVVAAHVTDRHSLALSVGNRRLAGIRQARRLFDRQCIHIGPQHDRRPLTVPQQTYDAGFTNASRHFEPSCSQTIGS